MRFGSVRAVALMLGWAAVAALANENATVDPNKSELWPVIKQNVFGEREIAYDHKSEVLEMYVPARAEDASSVPIIVRARNPQSPDRYIKNVWLIVDKNPSPMAGVFRFSPDSGIANLETRIRVEDYSHVRAIAESSDGKMHMAARWIKASGGCSAPAGGAGPNMANLGRMKFKFDDSVALGEPNKAQLMISHPNTSGLAMDQLTRLYPTPDYVKQVEVTYGGKTIMSAEVDFSISENPVFRFFFQPKDKGELKARILDTSERKFEQAVVIVPGKSMAETGNPVNQ